MDLREFIFNRLPYYYREHDTYKDGDDRGILERFLNVLGIEIQEEFVDKLEVFINELDPTTSADKYLDLLAFTVGSPTNILDTPEGLRERIISAISLYKVKGTAKSYKLLFNLLGYNVEIEELVPQNTLYDTELEYDDGGHLYDATLCTIGCIQYNLYYSDGVTEGPMSSELKSAVIATIKKDLEPLTAKLNQFEYIEPEEIE